MPLSQTRLALCISILGAIVGAASSAAADAKPCQQGLKGGYVTWSETGADSGVGEFVFGVGRASVLPDFTWEVTGAPQSVTVASDEPFGGGNSMEDIYGSAADATNLNMRIEANDVKRGKPIPHSIVLTLRFNATTPASGWGFAVADIDVDQVKITAKDGDGNVVPQERIAQWFIQKFDANPEEDGENIPSWDPGSAAVVGSSSSSATWRTTVEGGLDDTEAASAWFQPNENVSELTFQYQSLQDKSTPSYHVFVGACATTFVAATPTPAGSGDSDGDGLTDNTEGSEDPDADDRPNYLDKDSDGDSIPDSVEGSGDTDGDNVPDFVDEDSDGDHVPDRIERDPNGTACSPTGEDANRDGIDDGDAACAVVPPADSDSDSDPDHRDTDSDNDGEHDTDESYDLDGDGDRDVDPIGEDSNNNGIDDGFEHVDDHGDVSRDRTGGSGQAPCTSANVARAKARVVKRLNALAGRVPAFAARVSACGGAYPRGLVNSAAAARRLFERTLKRSFGDVELVCPKTVCEHRSTKARKSDMRGIAVQLFRYAKQSKVDAMRVCGHKPSAEPDKRPRTEAYLAQLESEVRKLPGSVTRCN